MGDKVRVVQHSPLSDITGKTGVVIRPRNRVSGLLEIDVPGSDNASWLVYSHELRLVTADDYQFTGSRPLAQSPGPEGVVEYVRVEPGTVQGQEVLFSQVFKRVERVEIKDHTYPDGNTRTVLLAYAADGDSRLWVVALK